MPRPLKPYKVDDVRSPNGRAHADVMFDRDKKEFFVEIVPGDYNSRVKGDTLVQVKSLAREALARAQNYIWTPLIVVSVSKSDHWKSDGERAALELKFERLERASDPTHPTRFVQRCHSLDAPIMDGHNKKEREQHRDVRPYNGPNEIGPALKDDGDALLPYDQATWENLCAIKRSIDGAYELLLGIMCRKDIAKFLSVQKTPPVFALPSSKK